MTLTRTTGYTGHVVTYRGVPIRKFIAGYAYPRNGNNHHPTPEVIWYAGTGPQPERFTYLRQAKAAIAAGEVQ